MYKCLFRLSILSLFLWLSCLSKVPQWVEKINRDNYSMVKLGSYPYTTRQLQNDTIAQNFRYPIEEHRQLMSQITRYFFPEEQRELNYEYRYTAVYENNIILRYFSMLPRDEHIAGYSIQFVIDNDVIKQIYLCKIPFEGR